MRFFKEENRQVLVDPEIKVIGEFRRLIAKDKDRKKRKALAWFAYIYYMNDWRSPYSALPDKERHESVCRDIPELEPTFKPFAELREAEEKYREFQKTPAVKSLVSIRRGLHTSSRVIDMLTTKTEKMLDTVLAENTDLDTVGELELIDAIGNAVDKMLKLSNSLPAAIRTITGLEEQVKKEQAGESKVRGGGETGAFEM